MNAKVASHPQTSTPEPTLIGVSGVVVEAFREGALWWADERLLVVADLHLEKGSSLARHGQRGDHVDVLALGRIVFRHEPTPGEAESEIAGHLHPAARVYGRGRSVRRRCFAGDGTRLILPAFGAYTGGLDVLDAAFAGLFSAPTFRAFMLGEDRVYAVSRRALSPSSLF